MSMMINGAGAGGMYPAVNGTLTIKNRSQRNAMASGISMTQSRSKKKTSKQLNYNHKEISSQIMRAKKAQSANAVLVRAKSKVSVLKRCAATGEYNSREVEIALAHAKRMVRCAQLKVNNLKQEEQEKKTHERDNSTEEQQKKNEVKRRAGQKERQLKQKIAAEEIGQVQQEKRARQQMLQKRRQHRNQERAKVNEADFKYLKAWTNERYGKDTSYYDDTSGVIVELTAEMQRIETEAEAEVDAELAAELAAEVSADTMAGDGGSSAVPLADAQPASAPSVDISL